MRTIERTFTATCSGKRISLGLSRQSAAPLAFMFVAFLLLLFVLMQPSVNAQALPEYSAQTGEPCASCHVSPSGGGPRGPRGQAWVGEGKPGAVPSLVNSLEALGVHLEVDPSYYEIVPESIPPAQPLPLGPAESEALHEWVSGYEGN